jgi:hypothetical protein
MSWHASRTLRPLLALFPSILETTPESLWPYRSFTHLSLILCFVSLFPFLFNSISLRLGIAGQNSD